MPQTEYSTVHAGFREIDWNAGVPACMSAKHEQHLPRGELVQRFPLTRIGRIKRIYADLRNLSIIPCVSCFPCIPWLFSSNPNHGSHGTRGTHGSTCRQYKLVFNGFKSEPRNTLNTRKSLFVRFSLCARWRHREIRTRCL